MTTLPPMRADARRNRDKLLAAATELFGSAEGDVSLEAVAKQAGVGIGTLYRHFPTRDALVEEAYRNEVARLCDVTGDVTLDDWVDRFAEYAATKRGIKTALKSAVGSGSDVFVSTRGQMLDAVTTLLAAGVEAGTLRADVTAEDVLSAVGATWHITDEDQARRVLQLLLDGLRPAG